MAQYKIQSAEFNNTTVTAVKRSERILVPDEVLSYFLLINLWGPGQCVTILGLIVNILNIVTFLAQGVRDSVNISLLGLTISDLGSLVCLLLLNLCWTPSFMKLDLPFYPQQIMYFLFWGRVIFTRVTTGTTAWIAFERCLCIVAPLKVKSIVTPKRTISFIFVLYGIMMAVVAPIFYTSRFAWIFDSARNKTLIGLAKIANRDSIESVVFLVNNTLPVIFFIFIVICTCVLVKTLRHNIKWRQKTTSSEMAHNKSNRDTKVAKLVLIISLVFIFCYAPGAVSFVWVLIDPELKIDGKQKNFMIAVFSVLLHLEGINATANFFIYITMSSKFKATFQQIFSLCQEEQNENQVQK